MWEQYFIDLIDGLRIFAWFLFGLGSIFGMCAFTEMKKEQAKTYLIIVLIALSVAWLTPSKQLLMKASEQNSIECIGGK